MSTRVKLGRWVVVTAFGYLVLMIATGKLPQYGHFNAADTAGLMREHPQAVTRVEITRGQRTVHLNRQGGTWQREDGSAGSLLAKHLESAIGFMHTARPVRRLPKPDTRVAALTALGLNPPRYAIRLSNDVGVLLEFELGGANPDGILRYLRSAGGELYLVSGFVGEAWDAAAKQVFRKD